MFLDLKNFNLCNLLYLDTENKETSQVKEAQSDILNTQAAVHDDSSDLSDSTIDSKKVNRKK